MAATKFHVLARKFCIGEPIKNKSNKNQSRRKFCSSQSWFVLISSIVLFCLLLYLHHLFFLRKTSDSSEYRFIYFNRSSIHSQASLGNSKKKVHSLDSENSCSGRFIYVHDLPKKFNEDLLENCQLLTRSTDKSSMCKYIQNSGLGPQIESSGGSDLWKNSWFSTNQFLLEVIFHNRMKKYKCLTNDSAVASAIFVPYYAGLDLRRYLWGFNASMRDSSGLDLIKWLAGKPEWKRMLGKDHFLISGRIARDFRSQSNRNTDWGSKFRFLPESENMTMLTIESGPWKNDIAVPYPTYFHPSTDYQVFQWQELMKIQNRPYLFSFAGAPRSRQKGSIRNEIISHCQASNNLCKLLDCNSVGHKCNDPGNLLKLFRSSIFCLQPPGDSLTRRSTFDSILAGCIPVFFHPGSAYSQYLWHLPKNYSKYSVFISAKDLRLGKVKINQTLLQVSKDEELAMREEVVRLIPRIIYADPRSRLARVEDAFDLAIKGILNRIESLRGSA